MGESSKPMRAHLPAIHQRSKLTRLVLVDDPDETELIAVWWDLDRPRRWRCSRHGRFAGIACDHIRAARTVLARHLLGAP